MTKKTSVAIKRALRDLSNPERAAASARFFKTGKGQYGAGDQFLGVSVPDQRKVARAFRGVDLREIVKLLASPIHEHRLTALILMVDAYRRTSKEPERQAQIVQAYLGNLEHVNNWDLVDTSASRILGDWLLDRDRSLLYEQITSPCLWTRRVAMIASQAFVDQGQADDALRLAEHLLEDEEDLMHKAAGWTLREVGKRCSRAALRGFLKQHAHHMPRTMLRYAIEHLDDDERSKWLRAAERRTSKRGSSRRVR